MKEASQSPSAKLGIHNWQKSKPASQGCGTKCVNQPDLHTRKPINGHLSTPSPTSPTAPTKITEHSKYCAICTPLGKICPEEFAMS